MRNASRQSGSKHRTKPNVTGARRTGNKKQQIKNCNPFQNTKHPTECEIVRITESSLKVIRAKAQRTSSRTAAQPMSPRTVNSGKYTTQEFTHSHNQSVRKAVAGPPRNGQVICKPCHSDPDVTDVALPSDSPESSSSTQTSSLPGDDASTPPDT